MGDSDEFEPGDLVMYVASPVSDLIIKTGETGIVKRTDGDWVYVDWPRCGVHSVPKGNVTHQALPSERDELVREIVRLGGGELLERDPVMGKTLDYGALTRSESSRLVERLRERRDQLRAEALERGWDVISE